MKTLCSILSATILFGAAIPAANAAIQVSLDFFHDNLESYGDWREVGDYGYCWQPRDVDRDWRPYNDGRWLYTDAGWTWDSDEPYSWAVYHYGRWAQISSVGWVWVPGTEWGPAWVSWRRNSDHVGWAPLPPEARFSHSIGFGARVDVDYDIGPSHYSFVDVRNFGAPRLRTVILPPRENITIIRQTTNITKINYVNNVVHNEGPRYDVISRQSEQPIRRLKLDRRREFDGDPRKVRAEQLRSRVDGDSFRVTAPSFDSKPPKAPRKVAGRVEKAEVNRGWKDAGPPDEVEKLRAKIKSEPAAQAELPSQPKTAKPGKEPAISNIPPQPDKKQPKPDKAAKGTKPVASSQRPPEPAVKRTEPSGQSKSLRDKSRETSRRPAEAKPQEKTPARMPKREKVAPERKLPPAATAPARQKVQPIKRDTPPKPKQSAARPIERKVPAKPESRPQARPPQPRQKAAPAVAKPQPPQPTKGKGKAKGKDEKKDADRDDE